MEPTSVATPVNSNTHATDNTEMPLASHSNDSPMVDHLNEEQNDNKPGEETKSNNNADMEPKSDATPVNSNTHATDNTETQLASHSNAINTVITGPPLTSHFYDAPQVGHPDEQEQKDNKHGEIRQWLTISMKSKTTTNPEKRRSRTETSPGGTAHRGRTGWRCQ
eukprot:369385_1